MEVETLWRGGAQLGEGPAWDASRGVLWFVDIKGPRVHRYDPATGAVDHWEAPAMVGWALPSEDGLLLVGLRTGLATFDPVSGRFAHLVEVEPDVPGNRLNDATVGADGTVWFGSMDDGETEHSGRVYRWDGEKVRTTGIEPVRITNGPAISPDGSMLYHVDTVGGIIHAVVLDGAGSTGVAREFAKVDPADGHPDGVTVDSSGNVWVGLWGGWRARRYSPDGRIDLEVRLPASNVTKVALGGPDLRTVYVTTAKVGLTEEELAKQPDAGGLFAFATDIPGRELPPARMRVKSANRI